MLSDRFKRLLTAAVDGELDQIERRAFQKLLEQSEEARHFYAKIKQDARNLAKLPRRDLPPHFSCNVLQAIGSTTRITPSSIGNSPKRFTLPIWANLAAAAAVMLAVCAGTYMIVVLNDQEKAALADAQYKKNHPEPNPAPAPVVPTPPLLANNVKPNQPVEPIDPPVKRDDGAVVRTPDEPKKSDPLFIEQNGKGIPFAEIPPADLPPIFTVRDLDDARFRESLNHSEAVHLDLFCRDTTRGFDRLQNAMKLQGQRLSVDALAQDRFNHKLATQYVFFTEAMTVDEIGKLFLALATEDRKAESRREAAFDKLVVKPLSVESQKTLSTLLGADVSKWFLPKKVGIDLTKPLSDSTAEKLAQRMASKTNPSATANSGTRPPDHTVLALSCNPIRPNPASSKEVKQFVEQRKDRKANAVPLLILVRTVEK